VAAAARLPCAGALLAVGTLAVDRATGYRLVPQSLTGTPSDAQTILSSFASAWCR
jgi:hypothetical protein